jgi:phosphatidylethanolamine-binding protein (PEBP) family uncharacterized protein
MFLINQQTLNISTHILFSSHMFKLSSPKITQNYQLKKSFTIKQSTMLSPVQRKFDHSTHSYALELEPLYGGTQ